MLLFSAAQKYQSSTFTYDDYSNDSANSMWWACPFNKFNKILDDFCIGHTSMGGDTVFQYPDQWYNKIVDAIKKGHRVVPMNILESLRITKTKSF